MLNKTSLLQSAKTAYKFVWHNTLLFNLMLMVE